eukprot:CAMPEP_0206035308 /NCGR_PEP_ID=MMETSP1466-20131121/1987_1 /ASSEMBLY_ACC=CAM_ASM_001126 /TAXON_ID=44452 /ORGANISM="Pavlova gyrans, Strain CCMP608" /LENGTH=36 /DNA_ID= /DNA_START= /DNA_END= /DNA_ORIENTATION=
MTRTAWRAVHRRGVDISLGCPLGGARTCLRSASAAS